MGEENQGAVDLWGNPWEPPRDPRGRKRHKPNPQGREIVAQLKAAGAKDDEVARTLGISLPTLQKYYLRELEHGTALARNEILRMLYTKAKAGNVTAMKAYLAQTEKGAAASVMRQPRAPKEPALGKKEQRRATAAEIGGIYAPGPAPKAH